MIPRHNILAIVMFVLFGIGTGFYYYQNAAHLPAIELFGKSVLPYIYYLFLCFFPIVIPRILQSFYPKRFGTIGLMSIGTSFLWVLLVTCIFTTARYGFDIRAGAYNTIGVWENMSGVIAASFGVFFRILGYLMLPIFILIISLGLGAKVLRMLGI